MEGIVQMIKIDATSRIAWACHLYLVAAGALPAMKGVIYNNFTSLVLLQCVLVLDKTSMIMTQIIRIIYLTHLHNLLTFLLMLCTLSYIFYWLVVQDAILPISAVMSGQC